MIVHYQPRILYPSIVYTNMDLWTDLQEAGWTVHWNPPNASFVMLAESASIIVPSIRHALIAWRDALDWEVDQRGQGYTLPTYKGDTCTKVANTYYHSFTAIDDNGKAKKLMGTALRRAYKSKLPR